MYTTISPIYYTTDLYHTEHDDRILNLKYFQKDVDASVEDDTEQVESVLDHYTARDTPGGRIVSTLLQSVRFRSVSGLY